LQLVEQLIAYEEGQITKDEEIELFQHLIETGMCWHLAGHYHRVAATLIEAGLIKPPEWAKENEWYRVLSSHKEQSLYSLTR
jgi:hypothetical protein